jgi:hypothetical protein
VAHAQYRAATVPDMPARAYRVTLEGELRDPATSAFADALVTREDGNTILIARDQAEMLGLLQRASDLGLTVLSAADAADTA